MGLFDGKVGLVTGAARGIGRGHAVRLADEGADVVVLDLCEPLETTVYPGSTRELLEETAQLVRDRGRRAVACKADVRDQASLDAAVDEGLRELGRIDIVSAAAGVASQSNIGDLGPERWAQTIDINLSGVWRTVKAVVPSMRSAGNGGSIVITSSITGLRAYGGACHYMASKHAVLGLMRILALEVAPDDIRVNAICPTTVDTPMSADDLGFRRRLRPDLESPTLEDVASAAAEMHVLPVPWIGTDDVANAFAWLSSDAARYVTGVALPVDAGAVIR